MKKNFLKFMFLILGFTGEFANAEIRGIFVSLQGKVEVLSPLEKSSTGKPTMIFEAGKYNYFTAQIGKKVKSGDLILSSSDGRAKIVFANGDVILVGSSSSLTIPIEKSGRSEMAVIYGKVRGIINREGPLRDLKVRTASAVAGVRGTDLYVAFDPNQVRTEVQVLRGEVAVEPKIDANLLAQEVVAPATSTSAANIISVKASEKLLVDINDEVVEQTSDTTKNLFSTEIQKISQGDIEKVKAETLIKITEAKDLTAVERLAVEGAEKSALVNVIEDIKRYNPQQGAQVEKLTTVDQANAAVLDTLKELAPLAVTALGGAEESMTASGEGFQNEPKEKGQGFCRADAKKLCRNYRGIRKAVRNCLRLNIDLVSPACRDQLEKMRRLKKDYFEKLRNKNKSQ